MSSMASQITCVSIVYWPVCSEADRRKHQSSALLAFVRGIHRWPVNSPHKWPVTQKMFSFDDVAMKSLTSSPPYLAETYWIQTQNTIDQTRSNIFTCPPHIYHWSVWLLIREYLSDGFRRPGPYKKSDDALHISNTQMKIDLFFNSPSDAYIRQWFNHHWFR